MLHILSFLIVLYILGRGVLPLPIGINIKIMVGFGLLIISQKYLVYQYWGGSLFSPELPQWLIILSGWLYGAVVFAFFIYLLKDIGLIIVKLLQLVGLQYRVPASTMKEMAVLAILALVLSGYSVWEAVRVPEVKTTEVVLPRLPKELDGVRVVVISDLHSSAMIRQRNVQAIVDRANGLNPDLILLTGDMIDGSVANREHDVEPLKELNAGYGVFACVGNHEYYSGFHDWMTKFDSLGIQVLANRNKQLAIRGKVLTLIGVTDPVAKQFALPEPDINLALQEMKADGICILMAHQPRGAWENYRAGVDLQLSGHTHGGMIQGIRMILEPFNDGFISGWYDVGQMKLYVSNGTGIWNGFPMRLGVPAEITQIVLRADAEE